ncbi:helix-turn-helix transcriptional regulator [Cellulomonas fimi]|uniref:Helix-turn-helix domain protein n=1 Tax=Cellulomonas fimi (strain ATCC 484 / DSM 20113 / JCM 1341 / CCUG 24087 / LMG 16345 / NBRC 15513 / NCIMB 8980 / NCTC 7547 / NRS-133) TaxID=590998 RepID=F4H1V0_CELFA|nr:helix-turn-helix domain-containing protein [Cellulomonas fimi]AEE47520.1 helix-turn-helix domain protein [Cellulomonas fimi ATCC 484]NNH05502.1 helix-turn-helix domain-containing protein [Cellulomonas fimi]VEH36457.1 transcriptional regulator, y4mF family [Cellulomonas fimi]
MLVRTMVDMGAVLRDAREAAGRTQAELARAAGVSREWLINVEAGRTAADLPRLLAVMGELGLVVEVRRS